jgi:hypothetical protein
MRSATKSNQHLALLFAIFLAIFSTGLVIAHQCNSTSSNPVSTQHHHSDALSGSSVASNPLNVLSDSNERLIDSGCVALFIVVLLLGRKYLDLRAPRSPLHRFVNSVRVSAVIYRPQVFQLALSRPQLGVIRI